MEQLLKLMKAETYSDSPFYDGKQFRGSSRATSSEAEAAFSKLLSFICVVPPADEVEALQSSSSAPVSSSLEKCSNEEKLERYVPL